MDTGIREKFEEQVCRGKFEETGEAGDIQIIWAKGLLPYTCRYFVWLIVYYKRNTTHLHAFGLVATS